MKTALVLNCLLLALTASAAGPVINREGWNDLNKNGTKDPYEDPAQPLEKRVADLLARMSLDEEIGQLQQLHREADAEKKFNIPLRQGRISSFLDGTALIETPGPRNRLQKIAIEQSRLGIPLIFGHDSIHGFRTIFPIPLAQACAWEPALFEQTAAISARETAAVGIDWTFAPMVDLARDPRWGRIAEGFGEDPWLGSLYAAACVRGFQGSNVADPDRVVACLKHYVGYGAAEGGRDYNTTEISDYTLQNFYLPQFRAGVDAGAWTVMSAFNLLTPSPASGNRHTLTDILRGQLKFTGFVVSDWESVNELTNHGVAVDGEEAARLALTAGVDMEMTSVHYTTTLKQQVRDKKIPQAVVDEAARRVLRVKFAKGLFDRPYVDETLYQTAFLRPDALRLAREAAVKSCVLLQNTNGVLPLSRQTKKLALIGPLAEDAEEMVGCWYARVRTNDLAPLAPAIRAKLPADAEITIARGCAIIEGGKVRKHVGDFKPIAEQSTGTNEIERAVDVAKAADVVVLALGEPRDWSGEDGSRSDLNLPGRQLELLDAVAAAGKPLVVVLFNGRPLVLTRILQKADAVLEAWHPGVQGGPAVADVLFGDADPAGRLTTTFPRTTGQVPIHYNHFNTGRPGTGDFKGNYADGPTTPLLPFGYGLAYTTFEYSKVRLSRSTLRPAGTLTARARVKNTGERAGTEVVQLYIRDLAGTAGPRPVRELKGFKRISLGAGESVDVDFAITDRDLGYYDSTGRWLVEPGRFEVWIAKDSASGEAVGFELAK
jgi:beta-glucosidase